jgi:peptidoglycan L-alanyl-D-glutamate endopeptidase CwlK
MPTRDIVDAAKPIKDNWETIKTEYSNVVLGKKLVITCVHRSPEEQLELYKKGRILGTDEKWVVQDKAKIVTNVDGKEILGAHNYRPARAIDVMVVDKTTGRETWEAKYYLPLGPIVRKLGLTWGGDWKSIKDLPHIEVKDYKNYKGD